MSSSQPRAPNRKLRLRVQSEGAEPQVVCEVRVEGEASPTVVLSDVSDLTVTSYTRDPIDFSSLGELRVLPADSADNKGLQRYRAYLVERRKVAVAAIGPHRLLLVPGKQDALVAYLTINKPVPPPTTQSSIAEAAEGTQAFENSVESQLHVFATDKDFNGPVAFPPMDKALRFIVHDVVEQFALRTGAGIVSVSEGEDEERHVVVYREGFQPTPIALELVERRAVVPVSPAQASRKPPAAKVEPPKRPQAPRLVNQVRDRRSVEEVQLERQRMKRAKVEDS